MLSMRLMLLLKLMNGGDDVLSGLNGASVSSSLSILSEFAVDASTT